MINPQAEFNCIKKVMTEKNPELLVKITPDDFGNQDLKNIFRLIQQFFLKQATFPGWSTLASQVTALCSTSEKANMLTAILMQIQERDISGLTDQLLLTELENYRHFRTVLTKSKDLISAVEGKDIEDTLGILKGLYDQVFVSSQATLADADITNLIGTSVKYSFHTVGVPELDERGPLIDGGVFLVAGGTASGKSNFSIMVALHSFLKYGESVAYFSYELSRKEIQARITSQMAEVNIGRILNDDLTDEERVKCRVAQASLSYVDDGTLDSFVRASLSSDEDEFGELLKNQYSRRPNTFYVIDETCNWDDLFVKMTMLRDCRDVKLFALDYVTLIPRGRADKGTQDWKYLLEKMAQIKLFAKTDGKKTRIISPAQYKDKEAELKINSNIQNDVDLYIALTQDNDDKTLGTTTVEFKKFRTFLGNPPLKPFKMLIESEYCKFKPFC
jgi:hypothetical protein